MASGTLFAGLLRHYFVIPAVGLTAAGVWAALYPELFKSFSAYIIPTAFFVVIPSAILYKSAELGMFSAYRGGEVIYSSRVGDRKKIKVDRVFAAILTAAACTCLYSAFFIVSKNGIPIHISGANQGTLYYFLLVTAAGMAAAYFFFAGYATMVRHMIRSKSLQAIIFTYVVIFVSMRLRSVEFDLPASIGIGENLKCQVSLLRLVSYSITQWAGITKSAMSVGAEVCLAQFFWPEKVFEFVFYLIILVPCAEYFMDVLFFLAQRRSKSESDGAVEAKAVRIAGHVLVGVFCTSIALTLLRIDLGGLGLFSGLIGAGLSISFRDLLNNFFSGMLLNLDNSIKRNDVIRVGDDVVGTVREINLRFTLLQTKDNVDILIPNGLLIQSRFENLTRSKEEVRLSLLFSVGQEVNPREVERVVLKACLLVPEVATASVKNLSALFFLGCTENANNFDLRFWVSSPDKGPDRLKSDVAYAIFEEFKNVGISLPVYRVSYFAEAVKQDRTGGNGRGGDEPKQSPLHFWAR